MVRPGDVAEAARLHSALDRFEAEVEPLLGLSSRTRREVLVAQIIESERRVRYVDHLRDADLCGSALEPASGSFDPLKGAILRNRAGDHDEACWLVLLSVHFGKHRRRRWELAASFYGRLGQGGLWNWSRVSSDVEAVRDWLEANKIAIRARGVGFGNHRKYESLRGRGPIGTGAVVATYVDWVGTSHAERFDEAAETGAPPTERFAALYDSLTPVADFGRVARFDYLTMLGKLRLADIQADSAHLTGSTGPLRGARLLMGATSGIRGPQALEARIAPLRDALDVPYDVLEDALCNWQKSPSALVPFRG